MAISENLLREPFLNKDGTVSRVWWLALQSQSNTQIQQGDLIQNIVNTVNNYQSVDSYISLFSENGSPVFQSDIEGIRQDIEQLKNSVSQALELQLQLDAVAETINSIQPAEEEPQIVRHFGDMSAQNSDQVNIKAGTVGVLTVENGGDIYPSAGATGMTAGFISIPSGAGTPTGTPTAHAGTIPLYYDTTGNYLYAYNGAWKKVNLT